MTYKKDGLCQYCGKLPPVDGRSMCIECTEKRKWGYERDKAMRKDNST
jgi:hypothetical protein